MPKAIGTGDNHPAGQDHGPTVKRATWWNHPYCSPSMSPNTSVANPTTTRRLPHQSTPFRTWGSLVSGTTKRIPASTIRPTGTLIKKAQRHE